jgi:hypothetical protein
MVIYITIIGCRMSTVFYDKPCLLLRILFPILNFDKINELRFLSIQFVYSNGLNVYGKIFRICHSLIPISQAFLLSGSPALLNSIDMTVLIA